MAEQCPAVSAGDNAHCWTSVESASGEGGEDSLVGLAGELAVAGFAQRGAGAGSGDRQQIVEAGTAHDEQAVGRSGTRHRQSAERGIELVEC